MNWPLVDVAIEPRSPEARERLVRALETLASSDPTYRWMAADGYFSLGGLSEDHLVAGIRALRADLKYEILVGAPQVAYRERLGHAVTIDHTYKRQIGGSGQFARVKVEFVPGDPGSSFKFENNLVGGAVPSEYVPGIEKGIAIAKENGLIAGFPVIEVTARLVDGAYHDLDSNEETFQIAAQAAFRELKDKADPRLAEPMMKVEVIAPNELVDLIIRDLKERRGKVQTDETKGKPEMLVALVPIATLFGYTNTLRAITGGASSYSMTFSHYEDVPRPDDDPTFSPAVGMRA